MRNKKFVILEVALPSLLAFILVVGCFVVSVLCPKDIFRPSYQSLIQDKYDNLVKADSPKIIIVAGSNGAFGIDEDMLSEATGYPVVNLGLHAGFHGLFNTEISKANIQKGDIVLLAYEYEWYKEGNFEDLGVDLIMSGIDSKLEMYQHIPLKNWSEVIGYLPEYVKTKASYQGATGVYSREAFDSNASMEIGRTFALQAYDTDRSFYGEIDVTDVVIAKDSIEYLKEYKQYVLDQGASIYFVAPPVYEKAIVSDVVEFDKLVQQEEEKIGIEYLSNPADYFYSDEYIFDSIYHCTNEGEKKRTEQLIEDLKNGGVIK